MSAHAHYRSVNTRNVLNKANVRKHHACSQHPDGTSLKSVFSYRMPWRSQPVHWKLYPVTWINLPLCLYYADCIEPFVHPMGS